MTKVLNVETLGRKNVKKMRRTANKMHKKNITTTNTRGGIRM